jgi:hypothetical protein
MPALLIKYVDRRPGWLSMAVDSEHETLAAVGDVKELTLLTLQAFTLAQQARGCRVELVCA